jgi:hypothetical protein
VILSDEEINELLKAALAEVQIGPDSAIVLEGSLAEGFGNKNSDIDFLVIEDREYDSFLIPILIFAEGRRIEVRVRSRGEIQREIQRVLGEAAHGTVSYDEIDRVQRLAHAYVLQSSACLGQLRAGLAEDRLRAAVSSWFRQLTLSSIGCASSMLALRQDAEAARWVRTALEQAAKTWLSERGETYIGSKWTSLQFARLGERADIHARFYDLASPARAKMKDSEYVAACFELISELLTGDPAAIAIDTRSCKLQRLKKDITTWQIGERLHIVHDGHVYVPDRVAAQVWRSLDFTEPASTVVGSVPDVPADVAGHVVAEFHRIGLVGVTWNGQPITVRGRTPAPTLLQQPMLSIRGAELPATDSGIVWCLPISANQFAAAGLVLVWANAEVENSREDALGAIDAGQWRTLESTVRRMARKSSVVILSANGIAALPSEGAWDGRLRTGEGRLSGTSWQRREADEESCLRLRSLPGVPAGLVTALVDLETSGGVTSKEEAERLLSATDDAIARVRDVTAGSLFPSSFVTPQEWRETLELVYDWVRLGAYVDSAFPLEEAHDVVASGAAARA